MEQIKNRDILTVVQTVTSGGLSSVNSQAELAQTKV